MSPAAVRVSALSVGLALMAGLTACAAAERSSDVARERTPGVPEGYVGNGFETTIDAVWIEPGARFAVVTWGSSSCAPHAEEIDVTGADSLEITFAPADAELCTADMAPTTHEFELPDGVTSAPLEVTVAYTDRPETHLLSLP